MKDTTKKKLEALKAVVESYTDRHLLWRVGLPAPLTFLIEAALWVLASVGLWKILS